MNRETLINIRRYTPRDADATIEIFLRAIREIASKDYNAEQVHAWAQVEDRKAWSKRRASRPTWIAIYGDEPVGFSDLMPDGHVDMMFVHPLYQGLGAATLLLNTVEQAAHAQI